MNKADILTSLFEIFLLGGVYFYMKTRVKDLRREVDTLKRDADNFGELLNTKRAQARINNKKGEKT